MSDTTPVINTESSLKAYFHHALSRATEKNKLETTDHTLWYLTNLLHTYSRSERFFDYQPDRGTLTPLADYYQRAVEAESVQEKRQHLQRLGDVAMFISGMFATALDRKAVGINYYMAMGVNAYGTLADTASRSSREKTQAEIFTDLSQRFAAFVNVLGSVGPQQQSSNPQEAACESLLQKMDKWQRNKDPVLASELRDAGVLLELDNNLLH